MRAFLSRAAALLAFAPMAATAQVPAGGAIVAAARTVPSGGPATLPSNSEIWLSLDRALDSRGVRAGSGFALSVSRDVMIGDHVVIPRGTPARGAIVYRTGKGGFGKSAKLEFDLVEIALPGRTIPIAGRYRISSEGNSGAAVGAVVAAGLIAGALVTGHSAVAAPGTEYRAFTRDAVPVILTPPAPMVARPSSVDMPRTLVASGPAQPVAPRRKPGEDVLEVTM